MNPETAPEPAEQTSQQQIRQELREGRRTLRRIERRVERRRAEVEQLRAQIEVLSMEARPMTERQAATATTPEELETDRGVPSFGLALRMHRRHNTTGVHRRHKLREPILDLYFKTAGREFASRHGVQVPAELGRWPTPDDIVWDDLPNRFVIKSNRGGGGVNVFPVERRDGGFYDFISQEPVTAETITERFWKKHQEGSVYFAEEFLVGRNGEKRMPDDIKVFCFYGEPAYIEVRREAWSRKQDGRQRVRTFLPDGTELFNARALIPYGDDITAPSDFAEIVEAAGKLSAAIRRPFQRLDFYDTDRGLVFGEVTQNPGWSSALVQYWDRHFGQTYEDASARLIADLVSEGHLSLSYGPTSED